jgi:hypothetical protein
LLPDRRLDLGERRSNHASSPNSMTMLTRTAAVFAIA